MSLSNPDSNYRKHKRRYNRVISKAKVGRYGMGCRGHPGVITETCGIGWRGAGYYYAGDFTLKSLIDGVEESCSMYHCGFDAMSKERAIEVAEYQKQHGAKMRTIHFWPEAYEKLERDYVSGEYLQWSNEPVATLQEYLGLDDREFAYFLDKTDRVL